MGKFELILVVLYLMVMAYLGFLGWRRTRSSTDYLLAGRQIHPFVMALSYGAAFISTSAIVGFGGVAGIFGMGLLWLVFLNIFVGIFVAFIFLGGPTRRIGHRLGAHTFPELLGKRFQSRFVQIFAGLIIFCFMPLYATAVLLGGAEYVHLIFRFENFNHTLLVMALVIGAYVLAGGLKGVMYNDALQGSIMLLGMALLAIMTYAKLGGVVEAHRSLTAMADLVPAPLQAQGHRGWTNMPDFGWGGSQYNLWWIMVSTIILGVGIGVLAQPQMAVRFMTVRSRRELNRAVGIGGFFILMLTGVAFTVGALSNAYFYQKEELTGEILEIDREQGRLVIQPAGTEKDIRQLEIPIGAQTEIIEGENGAPDVVRPRMISYARVGGNRDQIIPAYIDSAMPRWFGILFLLTLMSAAVSTLSSQFHAMGTAVGRDVLEQVVPHYRATDKMTIMVTRLGVILGLIMSLLMANYLRGYIAIATALFFGLCAAAFLPTFLGALFWSRMTRTGAVVSMVGGFLASATWMLFFFKQTAGALGICQRIFEKPVLLENANWAVVDPLLIGLPVSLVLAVVVSLVTPKMDQAHLDFCFRKHK